MVYLLYYNIIYKRYIQKKKEKPPHHPVQVAFSNLLLPPATHNKFKEKKQKIIYTLNNLLPLRVPKSPRYMEPLLNPSHN